MLMCVHFSLFFIKIVLYIFVNYEFLCQLYSHNIQNALDLSIILVKLYIFNFNNTKNKKIKSMLSFAKSLIHTQVFAASRQKIMLRRRKRQAKRQKSAQKQLKQHDPKMSLAHQLKLLQIQTQLDRKLTVNYHLNQLMDDLFYPDVRYANQKIMQKNVLKMTSNLPNKKQLLEASKSAKNQNQSNIQGQYEVQHIDQLIEQIYLCQLPSQMFDLFNKNSDYFGLNHTLTLLNRLRSYFKNRDKIKQKLTKKWSQSVQKMKQTSQQKVKIKKRCPYIFIDKDDLIRDEGWILMIKSLQQKVLAEKQPNKVKKTEQNYEDQVQMSKQQLEYIASVRESYHQVLGNCQLLLTLVQAVSYIPSTVYDAFISKIIKLSQKRTSSKSPAFKHQQMVKILLILTNKNLVKSHFTTYVSIQSPQESKQLQEKILVLGKRLAKQILSSQKCSSQNLGAVIRTSKGSYKLINHETLQLAKTKIIKFLYETNLQRTIDYLHCYWRNGTQTDMQFITILKYDIYRKLSSSFSKIHLFNLLKMIKYGQITFKQSEATVQVTEIYSRIVQTLTAHIHRSSLKHEQLQSFIKSIYQNYIICQKRQISINNKMSVLQMVCGQVIKMGDGYSLQDLSDFLFRVNVLGYHSKVLVKYVFERYKKQFKKQIKKYQEQKLQLLPNDDIEQLSPSVELLSLKQIQLNQSLIMMIWSLIRTIRQKQGQDNSNSFINLNQILQMWILKIRTDDSLVWQLVTNINRLVKQEYLFPQIKIVSSLYNLPYKQAKGGQPFPVLPTLKYNEYCLQNHLTYLISKVSNHDVSMEEVIKLTPIYMNIQAKTSQSFFGNFSLKDRKFLQNYVTSTMTYNKNIKKDVQKDYLLQQEYLDWLIDICKKPQTQLRQGETRNRRQNYFNNNLKIEDKQFLNQCQRLAQNGRKYNKKMGQKKQNSEIFKKYSQGSHRHYEFV